MLLLFVFKLFYNFISSLMLLLKARLLLLKLFENRNLQNDKTDNSQYNNTMNTATQIITKTLILTLLITFTLCSDDFSFSRTMQCQHLDTKGHCTTWSQSTTLYQYSQSIYYCFPGDLFVLTTKGPKKMVQLLLNDEILSMNIQTGKKQFSPIKAWLHRDPYSLLQYSRIELIDHNYTFLGSKYHNIAFFNNISTDFKFLKDLTPNDTLISISPIDKPFQVKSVGEMIQKQGLYSPMTQTGTFYILPESFIRESYSIGEQYPMILVHSLSQVTNPIVNFPIANGFITLSRMLFGSYQPHPDEDYVNPLLSHFNLLFGRDWVDYGGMKIAHRQNIYQYKSYSQTRSRRQQEKKKKTMVVLAIQSAMADTIL